MQSLHLQKLYVIIIHTLVPAVILRHAEIILCHTRSCYNHHHGNDNRRLWVRCHIPSANGGHCSWRRGPRDSIPSSVISTLDNFSGPNANPAHKLAGKSMEGTDLMHSYSFILLQSKSRALYAFMRIIYSFLGWSGCRWYQRDTRCCCAETSGFEGLSCTKTTWLSVELVLQMCVVHSCIHSDV